jgi:hypothetical protein
VIIPDQGPPAPAPAPAPVPATEPGHEAAPNEPGGWTAPGTTPPAGQHGTYDDFDPLQNPLHATLPSRLTKPRDAAPDATPATGPGIIIVIAIGAAGIYAMKRRRKT